MASSEARCPERRAASVVGVELAVFRALGHGLRRAQPSLRGGQRIVAGGKRGYATVEVNARPVVESKASVGGGVPSSVAAQRRGGHSAIGEQRAAAAAEQEIQSKHDQHRPKRGAREGGRGGK